MERKIGRRAVYAGTILALIAVIVGFAAAGAFSFVTFTNISVNGNQGAITTSGTIYTPGLSYSSMTTATVPDLCPTTNETAQLSHGIYQVATEWAAGSGGLTPTCGTAGATDFVLLLNFSSAPTLTAGTYTDQFTLSTEVGAATLFSTSSFTAVCTLDSTGECSVMIYIDTGVAATSEQPSVSAVDVTVTGS